MNAIVIKNLENKQINVFAEDFEMLDAYTQIEVNSLQEMKKIIDFCNDNTIVRPKGKNYIILIPNNKQTFGYETYEDNVTQELQAFETVKNELNTTAIGCISNFQFFFKCKDSNQIAKCKVYRVNDENIVCKLIIRRNERDVEDILYANDIQELTKTIINCVNCFDREDYIEKALIIRNDFI